MSQTLWEFTINGEEVDEPIGWDAMEITLQRDPVYHGLENIISDNIKFWGDGARLIKEAFELDGIDASLVFIISYSCDDGENYTTLFSGILNCFYYSIINDEVTIKIEPSGFNRKVKNRLTTPINLNSNISIDGNVMSPIDPFDLGLHSKAIEFYANLKVNDSIKNVEIDDELGGYNPPLEIDVSDISDLVESSSFTPVANLIVNSTSQPRPIRFLGRLKITHHTSLETTDHPGVFNIYSGGFQLIISNGTTNIIAYQAPYNNSGSSLTYDFEFDETITLPGSGYIKFYIFDLYANNGTYGPVLSYHSFWDYDSGTDYKVQITDSSLFNPSTTKAFLIHEAFAKIAESISGIQDSFRSEFFGRTNSEPYQYSETGCGAWTAITNGLNIRKMIDKNGALFPIITTFQDLFQAADAVWNLGMKIEIDYSGKEYIRVEPKEYFYNAKSIFNAFNISDLTITPAVDLIFNNFKIGFEKWNLNVSGRNAIDEFNSVRNYTVPVTMANKVQESISKYIASGYIIEQARRLQFSVVPTNDFETDNNLFFICTNISDVVSDKYTVPPSLTTYHAGTVSERDENFTDITNVLDPTTNYNYRISPARNALNWYKFIAPSIYKNPTGIIKFVSGEGNYQETDTIIGGCIVSDNISQNQNIVKSDIPGVSGENLFDPEYFDFTYPLSYNDFLIILANSEKAIQVGCGSSGDFIGFIIQLKYGPTDNGGMGTFKLLRGECIQGDFNNDFSNDFNVGNC